MMKNLLFTLMLFAFSVCCYGQNTYYWIGGNVTATSLTTAANWSLTKNGSAVASRNNTSDVLIFDGVTVSFEITSATIGKLIIQNNADISFERPISAGANTSTLLLSGSAGQGLLIDQGTLRIKGNNPTYNMFIAFGSAITGSVTNGGTVYIMGTASNRITLPTTNQLTFESGTFCTINSAGNPFNQTNSSARFGAVFKAGSTLTYQGGLSPFGNNAAGHIVEFKTGSNFVIEGAVTATNMFSGKSFANVRVKNPVAVALTETFINIDNLTIDAGATFLIRVNGGSAISGDLVNNGVFGINGVATTSQLILIGNGNQSITGTGTFNDLCNLSIGPDAAVTLNKSLSFTGTGTSFITGSLNLLGNVLSGTTNIQFKVAEPTASVGAIDMLTNIVTMADAATYNLLDPVPGMLISGAGIPANTYVVGTNSTGFNFTISKFPTATSTGVAITGETKIPTFITANTAGIDGSLTTPKVFNSGVNYVFNAATTSPFAVSNTNFFRNVTFNAAASTNKDASITGKLALNNVKLTIATGNTVTFSSTSTFDGTYNQNAYIATAANTSNGAVGIAKVNLLAAAKIIPVGTANYYTPITLTPTTASTFDVNVFEGVTGNATPNGTAVSAIAKQTAVDAVWNVNRTSGTGNVDVALGWQTAQEGSGFSTLLDPEIGIAQYTSGTYAAFMGTGNNALNMATNNFSSLSQFVVGKIGGVLPITLISFTGKKQANAVVLSWTTASEQRNDYFSVERSVDGINFTVIGRKTGGGTTSTIQSYSFIDNNPTTGNNYYRLVQYDEDGKANLVDKKVVVNMGFGDLALKVFSTSNSSLNLSISTPTQLSGNFYIYNLAGQKVLAQNLSVEKGTSTFDINIPTLAPGVYIAAYQSGNQMIREKFIK